MRVASPGVLAALLFLAACDDNAETAISTGDVVGTWTVALEEPATCGRNNPAPSITMDLAVLGSTDETVLTLMGTWELGPVVNPSRPLEGEVDLETGRFSVDFRREPPSGSPVPEARGRLTGTIVDYTTMSGELEDPIGTAAGILGAGSCRYAATGRR